MLRIATQSVLILPALAAAGVLPMLLFSVPEVAAEGKWRGAAFGALAIPGLLALVATVVAPSAWQHRPAPRRALAGGLIVAGAACVLLAQTMLFAPDGRIRALESPMQVALVGGPSIVVVWNLWRLGGRAVAMAAVVCGLAATALTALVGSGPFRECTRASDATTGEHRAC